MHNTPHRLLEIIKLALWDKAIDESQLSSLDYKEWQGLYQCACVQGLAAIFFDGVDKLQMKSKACRKLLSNVGAQTVIGSETRWLGQMQVATALSVEFKKHGLQMLLLKGLGLSLCYPNPKHRECGDIDIYLFGDYEKCNRITEEELGGKVEKFSKKEDHIVIGGFSIDNHKDFLWTASKNNREIDHHLKSILKVDELPKLLDTDILLPTIEFNFLFLIVHSFSHFMREGMSLRQMTDIACFLEKNEEKLDWQGCIETLQRFRLKRFADGIISFIKHYFGLTFSYAPSVETVLLERMKADIMEQSHVVVYHKTRLASKLYIARNAWQNRWRYNAFFEGGFRQYAFEALKNQINL